MRTFAPEHLGPRVTLRLRGAFVVTPASIRAVAAALREFGGSNEDGAPSFRVLARGQETLELSTLDELLALRNPRSTPIETVFLLVGTSDRAARAALDSTGYKDGAGIVLDAVAESADILSRLAAALDEEAKNTAAWYSAARRWADATVATLVRVPWRIWLVILAVLGAGWVYSVVSTVSRLLQQAHRRERASILLSEIEEAAKSGSSLPPETIAHADTIRSAVEGGSWIPLTLYFIVMIGFAVLVAVVPRLFAYLFPRVEFLIGDGVERHARIRATRGLVLVTVLLSGFLLPLARAFMF